MAARKLVSAASIALSALSALSIAACGRGAPAPAGRVNFTAATSSRLESGQGPRVCGTFTLQPYSLDAAGATTLAGSPVTVTETGAGVATAAILGCIDSLPNSGTPASNDWGYFVTATSFVACDGSGPIPGLSPAVVARNYPVNCVAGRDQPLAISVDVSIPVANAAGYLDISVQVNSTAVQTGCKQADLSSAGILKFGESYIDLLGANHDGLVGLNAGTPTQYAGTVTPGLPAKDTYYTGQVGAPLPSLLFQTFLNRCAAPTSQYLDTGHAQCVTTPGPSTSNALADVFFADPGWGYASASIASGAGIQLYWNAAAVQIMTVQPATVTNFNGVAAQSLAAPGGAGLTSFTGLFLDLTATHQLLVTGLAGGVPSYAALSLVGAAWALGAALPLPSLSEQARLGLFAAAHDLCLKPSVSAQAPATGPLDMGTLGGNESYPVAVNASGQVVGQANTLDNRTHAFSWTLAGGMVDLGTLGGTYSSASVVNASGQVAGYSNFAGGTHAFSWTQGGGMVDLGTLGGNDSYVNAISASGQVVGSAVTAGGDNHAFSWTQAGGMVDLGTLGGAYSSATAVNASGQVVGSSPDAGGTAHAFSWTQAGAMVDLGTLGGAGSYAIGVTNSGQVVGFFYTAGGAQQRIFSWTQAGGMVDLGGTQAYAYAVNDSGLVVGLGNTAGGEQHAFSWKQVGGMVDLGTLGGTYSSAAAVNASGQVVGYAGNAVNDDHAFSWTQAGGMVDLGTLGGTYSEATAVNDSGLLVGVADPPNGRTHAALWVPGPNPDKRVFVTSTAYAGNLGGLAGADQHCQDHATTAGLPGHFKAWLSSSTVSARDRLTHSYGKYKLVDGTVAASWWGLLVASGPTGGVSHVISRDETGADLTASAVTTVWTGTQPAGTSIAPNCGDWTDGSNAGSGSGGQLDSSSAWTNSGSSPCSTPARIYCLEQ